MSEEDNIIDNLVLSGGLEVSGVDADSGELLYSFTPKLKDINPELFKEHLNHVNQEIMRLWEKGYVNVDFMEDDPVVTLSNKSFNDAEISKLTKAEQWSLLEIKRLLKHK
jgi:hypothetical protein